MKVLVACEESQKQWPNSGGGKKKMVQTKKYKPGQYIVSLNHLMEQERIFFMGKIVNRSWFVNWQLWYADLALSKLDIREAVKTEEEHEAEKN